MLNVLITIDVENPQTDYREGRVNTNLVDPLINNEHYGVAKLADIFDHHEAKAVFFITTSEKYIFDESFYKSLCVNLHSRGHEIGIHSHPEWMTDDKRIHMWQFSYNEQLAMLREMMQDIKKWTGETPISHRAGAYGINLDTFKALHELKVKVDSSMFAGHKNCKLQLTHNNLIKVENLLEVPVTGFYRLKRLQIWPIKITFARSFVKTDIETCSLEELKWFVNYAITNNLNILNLFMHSYSLFSLERLPEISTNNNDKKLRAFICYLKDHPGVKFTTLRDLSSTLDMKKIPEASALKKEKIPILYQDLSLWQFLSKSYKKMQLFFLNLFRVSDE